MTFAVKVTGSPTVDGFSVDVTVVPVFYRFTVCVGSVPALRARAALPL
jgi:hypothetical protein